MDRGSINYHGSPMGDSVALVRGAGSMCQGPAFSPATSLAPFRSSFGGESSSTSPDATNMKIGRGAFGTVSIMKMVDEHGAEQVVARKSVPVWKRSLQPGIEDDDAERRFALRYLSLLESDPTRPPPGLVRIMSAAEYKDTILITMEYMDLGHIGLTAPVSHDMAAAAARQLLMGLSVLHGALRTVHRDIKPENILVNSRGEVKLADFGVAAVLPDGVDVAYDQVGSILQMSPERLRGEAHGTPSDVWALGVTIAQIVLGRHPFVKSVTAGMVGGTTGATDRFWQIAESIQVTGSRAECEAAIRSCLGQALSHVREDLRDFVTRCTAEDPFARAAVDDLMRHPFIAGAPAELSVPALFPLAACDGPLGPQDGEDTNTTPLPRGFDESLILVHNAAAAP